MRTKNISNVKIGNDGEPTKESLNTVLGEISERAGQGGRIEGAYIKSNKFKEMRSYAESKKIENNNSNRRKYSLLNNNCGTFAVDIIGQDPDVQKKSPTIIDPRPISIIEEYQENFRSITYDPKKHK